ncbi:hypothetical protein [Roseisolibacter agri]|uniref:Uncharacterized protein n=1 Tax=Roseisolibacter agri TaxID=2014610 RepID=A0AA37V5Y5_9BACT|nr:hypothetical protein [Roseisolibacter agri]GLC24716.1 hypothetical protein rosag_12290 [Roseisolibacter agri]
MRTYLDTYCLSALEQALKKQPQEAVRFLDTWRDAGCVLTLTQAHLLEIGQLANEQLIAERLSAVALLGPALLSTTDPRPREALVQLLVANEVEHPELTNFDACFPSYEYLRSWLFVPASHDQIQTLVLRLRDKALAARQLRVRAAAQNTRTRIERQQIKKSDPAFELRFRKWYESGLVREYAFVHRTEKRPDVHDYEMIGREFFYPLGFPPFFDRIAVWAETLPSDRMSAIVHALDPYHAPAMSYTLMANRVHERSTRRAKPSDLPDWGHLAYAPYVDLAFADKATVNAVESEIRDRPQLVSPWGNRRITRAASIGAMREAIVAARESLSRE